VGAQEKIGGELADVRGVQFSGEGGRVAIIGRPRGQADVFRPALVGPGGDVESGQRERQEQADPQKGKQARGQARGGERFQSRSTKWGHR